MDFKINLSKIYPKWPENVDRGDELLINIMKNAIQDETIDLNPSGYAIFHHVDSWPVLNLHNGKPFHP